MATKATVKVDKIKGNIGVNADGSIPNETAYMKVRQRTERMLQLVRERKAYYAAEEKRLVKELERMPPLGQMSYLEEEE